MDSELIHFTTGLRNIEAYKLLVNPQVVVTIFRKKL